MPVLHLLLLMTLLLPSLAAADAGWPGTVPDGEATTIRQDLPTAVGVLAVTVHHPGPAIPGPWPVVVFSHGLGGSRDGYAFLGRHWAGHGYVVIHPTHAGSDTSALQAPGAAANLRQIVRDPAILRGRPAAISAVLDALPELERRVPALAGRLDPVRLGVGGHSFGAWTTCMVAGMELPGLRAADPRPRAFLALSPPGPGERLPPDGGQRMTRPLLIATGSEDHQPRFIDPNPAHDGAWRASLLDHLPPGAAALAWLEGARHSTFSGGAGAALMGDPAPDPAHLTAIQALTLAWWDWRLRDDAAAAAWLRTAWATAPGRTWRER